MNAHITENNTPAIPAATIARTAFRASTLTTSRETARRCAAESWTL